MTKWCCEKHYNKCPAQISLKTDILKKSGVLKGKIPWNKGKRVGFCTEETKVKISTANTGNQGYWKGKSLSKEHKNKVGIANKLTIEQIRERYPFFSKMEEMRYNPNKLPEKEIQFHCKYNECKNSKENSGWFTPTKTQFNQRKDALEKEDGNDGRYLYCSEGCKHECCLYYFRTDPNIMNKLEKYRNKVFKETYKTTVNFFNKIKNIELRGKDYHLDHKYSIYDGFTNNVDPKIISHYKNLECISGLKNIKKGSDSSITLEELSAQINF